MKNVKPLSFLIALSLLLTCKTARNQNNKSQSIQPIEIVKATYENWVGGLPGVKGTRFMVTIKQEFPVTLDSIFFKNFRVKLTPIRTDPNTYKAIYTAKRLRLLENDFNLNADAKKEYGNSVSNTHKSSYNLKEGEGIISYLYKGEKAYYSVKEIVQVKTPVQKY